MTDQTTTLLTTELLVIGWLGQLSEAAVTAQPAAGDVALQVMRHCVDRIRHITQSALTGLNESTRAQCIRTDIAFVASTLEQHEPWLSATRRALPRPDQVRRYLQAAPRTGSLAS